ncbi:MAG TPA: hypothetical protein DEF34_10595 [Desulfotomaculum sp.]|nr:MAG: hypothetical protein JL56_04305 [Desulfotomaculum sp. BICA1-6]HBX24060.1 hypothetical protein [Desulfotomaculum sp.]
MSSLARVVTNQIKILKNQDGISLILVAILLVILMGFAALSVDAGLLYKTRRDLVTAADAAALAGAKQLELTKGADLTGAGNIAENYAIDKNMAESVTVQPIMPVGTGTTQVVDVTVQRNVDFYFARVLGFIDKTVTARAVATWSYLALAENIVPLYYTSDEFENNYTDPLLHLKSSEYTANWGIFSVSPTSLVEESLRGNPITIDPPLIADSSTLYETQTGAIQAIIDALDKDTGGENKYGWLYKHQLDPTVSMVGLIPIVTIKSPEGTNGPLDIVIDAFAYFEVQDVVVDNHGNGSKYATIGSPPNQYDKTIYDKGTVIGQFIIDPDTNKPKILQGSYIQTGSMGATFIKLIE